MARKLPLICFLRPSFSMNKPSIVPFPWFHSPGFSMMGMHTLVHKSEVVLFTYVCKSFSVAIFPLQCVSVGRKYELDCINFFEELPTSTFILLNIL